MATKEELEAALAKCREISSARAERIQTLKAKLAKCRETQPDPDPLPDPDPEPDPDPIPVPPGDRKPWVPSDPSVPPAKGDFPSLDKGNVGLVDPAILTKTSSHNPVAGQSYENLDIQGSVTPVNGTSYRNCRFTASGYWAVRASSGVKADFHDCELVGRPDGDAAMDCNGAAFTLNRCYLHGSEDGAKLASGTLNDCLITGNASSDANPHYDGLQSMSGHGCRLHHCFVQLPYQSGGTAAWIIKSDFGAIDDYLIDYCFLDGHSWTLDVCDGGHGQPTNIRANYNRFGLAVFGAWTTHGQGGLTTTSNVWDSDGKAITNPSERTG